MTRQSLRRSGWIGAAVLVLGVGGLLTSVAAAALWSAFQSPPDFYVQAVQAPPPPNPKTGDAIQHRVAAVRRQVDEQSLWSLAISDVEVNGWLAFDLPEKYPQWTSDQIQDPRVAFDEDLVKLAFVYRRGALETVISIEASVAISERPNELAVKFQRAHAGALPLPMDQVVHHVDRAAARMQTPVRWIEADNRPVALVRLPLEERWERRDVLLEAVAARPGELLLGGRAR